MTIAPQQIPQTDRREDAPVGHAGGAPADRPDSASAGHPESASAGHPGDVRGGHAGGAPADQSETSPVISRRFTRIGHDPFDSVEWERRDSRLIDHRDGSVAFEQLGVEVPADWSVNATNILAQKYFRGTPGTVGRESSLRQVVARIVGAITAWGQAGGYFADAREADSFCAELSHLLVTQKAAFNSPVWFNIGVEGVTQQASACFILSVDDNMNSILDWYGEEGRIFKGGSGAGVNLSRIRGSEEPLDGGGTASGPVSFMRGADASAGTIKSGGKTRRAAKMVLLDADHPDIEQFIWCKAREERKARALEAAGFDMTLDGADIHSVQYQNANNSVRVSDEFMQAVLDDSDWQLTARTSGEALRSVPARRILRQIAEASWECADPGVQFHTTINRWHTAAASGPINASNPCSEYVHLDDSACNLASLNLLSFLTGPGELGADAFDSEGFAHAVRVLITAQEILVGNADYPTERIAETTRAFRQLGLGYANLGAMLMALGLAYDSEAGRAVAASVTALMTGEAYRTSARLAERLGPFAGYPDNREHMLGVLEMHRRAAADLDEGLAPRSILEAARNAWDEACERAAENGTRNSQATVLAPTGTIGLLMDCDTTGIEPELGLVKFKRLVGGGTMSFVNRTVGRALACLGYSPPDIDAIVDHIAEHHSVLGAPGLDPAHFDVFACSLGADPIHYLGHVKMMSAVQPFLSGAISKTVNLPEQATVEEIEMLLIDSWRLGLKSVALYRDNCKVAQPLSAGAAADSNAASATGSAHQPGSANGVGDSDSASSPGTGSPEPADDLSDAGGQNRAKGTVSASNHRDVAGQASASGHGDAGHPGSPGASSPGNVGSTSDPDSVDEQGSVNGPGGVGGTTAAAVSSQASQAPVQPVRNRLPRSRDSLTFEFRVADCKGFVTVGQYADGRPGEVFVNVSKQGSTLAGIMDAFAISVSHGLQYGVPLSAFVAAFVGMRFEPAGMTDDPDIRIASSLMDFLFRKLALLYLDDDERAALGILTAEERIEPTLPGVVEQVTETVQGSQLPPDPPSASPAAASASLPGASASSTPAAAQAVPAAAASQQARQADRTAADAPFCMMCGIRMIRAGACFVCDACGTTSGCS